MNAKSFEEASLIYDPPQGWLYGFPRPYRPLEGERLEDTLIRDGYPMPTMLRKLLSIVDSLEGSLILKRHLTTWRTGDIL